MSNGTQAGPSKLKFWSSSRQAYEDGLIRIEWTSEHGTHSTVGRYYADDNCVTWDHSEPKSTRIYNLAAECAAVAGDLADPPGAEFQGWETSEQMEEAVALCCVECGARVREGELSAEHGECGKCHIARLAKEAA